MQVFSAPGSEREGGSAAPSPERQECQLEQRDTSERRQQQQQHTTTTFASSSRVLQLLDSSCGKQPRTHTLTPAHKHRVKQAHTERVKQKQKQRPVVLLLPLLSLQHSYADSSQTQQQRRWWCLRHHASGVRVCRSGKERQWDSVSCLPLIPILLSHSSLLLCITAEEAAVAATPACLCAWVYVYAISGESSVHALQWTRVATVASLQRLSETTPSVTHSFQGH